MTTLTDTLRAQACTAHGCNPSARAGDADLCCRACGGWGNLAFFAMYQAGKSLVASLSAGRFAPNSRTAAYRATLVVDQRGKDIDVAFNGPTGQHRLSWACLGRAGAVQVSTAERVLAHWRDFTTALARAS